MSGQHAGPGMVETDAAPASREAEVSVLGAMLLEEEARRTALERLEPADFHHEGRRRIFAAFERLNGRGRNGDVTTLADELEAAGGMEALPGWWTRCRGRRAWRPTPIGSGSCGQQDPRAGEGTTDRIGEVPRDT